MIMELKNVETYQFEFLIESKLTKIFFSFSSQFLQNIEPMMQEVLPANSVKNIYQAAFDPAPPSPKKETKPTK